MYSSFNLGVAITAISIFVSLASFSLDTKFNLRFRLRGILIRIAIYLSIASILSTFLAEFSFIFDPFILQITGATLMAIAIGLYFFIVFISVKTINKSNIKPFTVSLNNFLVQRNQSDLMKHLEDIVYFYDSLLEYSVENKNAQLVFSQYFSSNLLLTLFSEHGFLFERTLQFYLEKRRTISADKLYHIGQFINNLFAKSLNNRNSYLNSFLNEDIYPNSLSYLDELFTKRTDINYSKFLFDEIGFNNLSIEGKISYMKMAGRYFKLIHRTNMSRKNQEGYEKKIDYNDNLIKTFFKDIKVFFEYDFEQNNLRLLFEALGHMSWNYRWAVRTNDKSEDLRKAAGIFLYEILHSMISKYKIENEGVFRLNLLELFDKYLEGQENSFDSNIAYKAFIEKLKEKIIGNDWGANYKGYYPAMIRIYFYIFGFHLFSDKANDYQRINLDLPILLKLKESLPKLYNGFKQEFYDVKTLPEGKEEKLQREGRKIIDDFLPDGLNYEFSDNSLTYYYSGHNNGSKILLNNVSEESAIVIEKV